MRKYFQGLSIKFKMTFADMQRIYFFKILFFSFKRNFANKIVAHSDCDALEINK